MRTSIKLCSALFRKVFVGLLLFFIPYQLFSQVDDHFWIAAPDLYQPHGDRPVLFRISSFDAPALVQIKQPANPAFTPITVSLNAYSTTSVDLSPWLDQVENSPANTVNNKGLLISSTGLISVYYDVAHGFNGDMFSLKGKNALGYKFTVPFQNAWSNLYPSSSIEIVATENQTNVTVIPTRDLVGHPANQPFTITLQMGQTFSLVAAAYSGDGHPAGTVITSSKPIAVTVRDESINPGSGACYDTAGDQLIPDNKAGTEFIVIKGFLQSPDNFYVVATADQTTVSIDGVLVATLQAGASYRHILTNSTAYIETSNPSHVFHITGFGCEVGGAIVPPLKCTGSKEVTVVRATSQSITMNILAPSDIIGFFKYNGQPGIINAAQFQTVPSTAGRWSYASINFPLSVFAAGATAGVQNDSGKFHLGLIHGDQTSTCRYGYFSDFGRNDIHVANSNTGTYCIGSSVTITATSNTTTQFSWTGPNGFISTNPSFTLTNLSASHSGYYIASTANDCGLMQDSVFIGVSIVRTENMAGYICGSEPYIAPWGEAITVPGLYKDTLHYANGCDSLVREVQVFYMPVEIRNSYDTICASLPYTLPWGIQVMSAGSYSDTSRYVNGCDSLVSWLHLYVAPAPIDSITARVCANEWYFLPWGDSVKAAGIYKDTIRSVSGCDSLVRIVNLAIDPLPEISVSKSNDINCRFPTATLSASGGTSYLWTANIPVTGAGSPDVDVSPATHTIYKVQVRTANGCSSEDSIEVKVYPGSEQGYVVPSAFTPNHDGKNDCFGLGYWGNVSNFSVKIFNRWGTLVFQSSDPSRCWDGTIGGKSQPSGVYVYIISADSPCGKVSRRGSFMLIR